MNRRNFIIKTGVVITATTFLAMGSDEFIKVSDKGNDKQKRPNPADFPQPILKAIAFGINAPSPHNTQSWKFKILDDNSINFYVNENILLPATDPLNRQIHIGAGCFIETLSLGISSLGYETIVSYFPEGYDSPKDFGIKPVAKIELKQGGKPNELAKSISQRQTNRKQYEGEIISKDEFQTLKGLAGETYAQLGFINENMKPFFDIFYKAMELETRTFRTNEETRKLFRFNEKQRAEKRDGLSVPQGGYGGIMKVLAEMSLDNGNSEKWHSDKTIKLTMKDIGKGIETAKGIVYLITPSNTYEDWLKAGRDYVRFTLALTKQNLYAHPYSQALQEYPEMSSLKTDLEKLLNIKDAQKIQMIVRIGRSDVPYLSYRRKVVDFILK